MIRQLLLADERAPRAALADQHGARHRQSQVSDDPRFPSLSGAAEEAARVAGLLSDEAATTSTLLLEEGADPMAVLSAMHERPWRILHLAAHGVFEFDREDGKGRRQRPGARRRAVLHRRRGRPAALRPGARLHQLLPPRSDARRLARRAWRSTSWRPTSPPSSSRWARARSSPRAGPWTMPRRRRSPPRSTGGC